MILGSIVYASDGEQEEIPSANSQKVGALLSMQVDAMHIAQWLVDPDGMLSVLFKPLWESPADDAMLLPLPC